MDDLLSDMESKKLASVHRPKQLNAHEMAKLYQLVDETIDLGKVEPDFNDANFPLYFEALVKPDPCWWGNHALGRN